VAREDPLASVPVTLRRCFVAKGQDKKKETKKPKKDKVPKKK
jgi:hypothetical protein